MHDPKDIAEAYLIESTVDIETARLTNINGLYSRTIHFSQECVEKITKACLALREIFTRDHKTSTLFLAVFRNEIDNIDEIITTKCNEHYKLIRQMARIEGENIAILAMLGIILIIIIERLA